MPPPPRLSNIFQKIYQKCFLPEFTHEIDAIWLLSQTVRTRFQLRSECKLCINSGARQKQRAQRVGRPEPKKPTNLCDLRPRNEKRPAVDLSTPGVKSFGRQSSSSDESSPSETLFVTILSLPGRRKVFERIDLRSSRPVRSRFEIPGSNW